MMVKAAKTVGALEKMGTGKLMLAHTPQPKDQMKLSLGSQSNQTGGLPSNPQWSYSNHLTPIQK